MLSLVGLLLLSLQNHAFAAAGRDRKEAFIGYHEADCTDVLPACGSRSLESGCLKDPYVMRRFCPVTCNVERCTAPGNAQAHHKGAASPTGTAAFASRWGHAVGHIRAVQLVPTDPLLHLSSLGVGTYLGDADADTDEAVTTAVIYSVMHGFNVIDTASNYRSGQAEVAVGRALAALLAGDTAHDLSLFDPAVAGDVTRDQLFISSKAGFVSPPLLQKLLKMKELQHSDVVQDVHTLHPAYLRESLKQSLERMGIEQLDLLYLHNAAELQLPAVGRAVFMERLRAAFTYLEAARSEGQLLFYGLATWDCLRVAPLHKQYLALQDVVALAREVGGVRHGFRFVQLPVNVMMTEAYRQPWQPVGEHMVTTLEAARLLQLGVFTSGPLAEAELIQRMTTVLDSIPELMEQPSTASKLLQMARSTPGVTSTLVGHKTREFVEQNVQLVSMAPLTRAAYESAASQVAAILS